MPVTPDETLGAAAVWLLDLQFSGQTYRFATQAVEVVDDLGATFRYSLGLQDFDFDYSDTGFDLTVGVEIDADTDWSALVASGVQLERAPAVLRRWFEGQSLDRARVVVRGITAEVEYGAKDESIELSVMSAPVEQSDTLPPTLHTVGPDTWPVDLIDFDEKIEGAMYPIVIGFPGTIGDGIGAPAVPGLLVDRRLTGGPRKQSKVLFAGHEVHASDVGLHDLTDTPTVALRPAITGPFLGSADLLGQPISYADFVGAGGGFDVAADRSWYISFDEANGGGLLNEAKTAPLRGAGEVLRYFLERHTRIPVDHGRMIGQDPRLNAYFVDTYINTTVNVWDWLSETVLPLLPVIPVQTSRGLFWRFLDWNASAKDSVFRLDADNGQIERATSVRTMGDPIYNEIAVEYAPFATSMRYRKRVVATANAGTTTLSPAPETDTRVIQNLRCRISQQVFGVKPFTFTSSAVWSDATATRIARDLANRFALPHRRIGYVGGPTLEALEIGSIVLLNDSELSISDAAAIVFEVTVGNGAQVEIDLVLVDNPAAFERLTA